MHKSNIKKSQLGLSLIELMIAAALGVVIILGVTTTFTSIFKSSRAQLSDNEMQQTADMAFSYISYHLRNTLSTPCDQYEQLSKNRIKLSSLKGEDIEEAMSSKIINLIKKRGIDVEQTSVTIGGKTIATDNLSIATAGQKNIITGRTNLNGPIKVKTTLQSSMSISDNPLYAITDCSKMDIFRGVATVKNGETTITLDKDTKFQGNYKSDSPGLISPLEVSTFYINDKAQLFHRPMYDLSGVNILSGIESMRILFGIDSKGRDGIIDSYITAAQLSALPGNDEVISAEVHLIVRAPSDQLDTTLPKPYSISIPKTQNALPNSGVIPLETIEYSDQIIRKVFSKTITLRNKATI